MLLRDSEKSNFTWSYFICDAWILWYVRYNLKKVCLWSYRKANKTTSNIEDGDYYRIKNVNSGLYLDVKDGVDSNIQQYSGNGSTTRVLDVSGNRSNDGQNVLEISP